jgi:hypothetical protein
MTLPDQEMCQTVKTLLQIIRETKVFPARFFKAYLLLKTVAFLYQRSNGIQGVNSGSVLTKGN